MIIKITYNKGSNYEDYLYIYCPNNINIKIKNIKSQFNQWSKNMDKEFFEIHENENCVHYDIEDMLIYWINKYILNNEYGDKACLLEKSKDTNNNYDININIDSSLL
ncbi:MAG: hypothetical protein RSD36_13200 [Terrisporobacter sp.]